MSLDETFVIRRPRRRVLAASILCLIGVCGPVVAQKSADIVTVETKKALSFHSAETLTPEESAARIEAGVRSALSRVREFKPFVMTTPVTLEMSYKNYAAAEIFSYLPGMERVGARTVKYVASTLTDAVDIIMVAESYRPDLSP